MLRHTSALLFLCLTACGSRTPADLGSRDGAISSRDAESPADAGRRDARRPDAGFDAGGADTRLARALACEMDPDAALGAIVRRVACDGESDATVRGLYEAWEAGLLGHFERVDTWIPAFEHIGCEAWRCLATARGCDAAEACIRAERIDERCEFGSERCDGTHIARCARDGDGMIRAFDCASVGASCNSAVCQLGDCDFGLGSEGVRCDEEGISICDGAVRTPCAAWGAADTCGSFYIGGELPTSWCGPSDSGAYPSEVTCGETGAIRFTSVSGVDRRFDCRAAGYAGCDPRGCRP